MLGEVQQTIIIAMDLLLTSFMVRSLLDVQLTGVDKMLRKL